MVKFGSYRILKKASYFTFQKMKPSAQPSAKKLLPPKQKQKEKKLLPSAEASAFGPPLVRTLSKLKKMMVVCTQHLGF